MTAPQSTTTTESSLGRDVLHSARYHLGNRWALLVLGSLGVIAGLSLGGWAWLVAVGLAPIILAALPCLVMCGLCLCLACRSSTAQATPASPDATNSTMSPTSLGVARMEQPTVSGSSCQGGTGEPQSPHVKQVQALDERMDSHA